MNDIEKFFYDTMVEKYGPKAIEPGFCGMGDLDMEYLDSKSMHPTRKDEAVYCHCGVSCNIHQFTSSFVKECFEASKDGKNALEDFLYIIHPIL
jgi:hypothetical protein